MLYIHAYTAMHPSIRTSLKLEIDILLSHKPVGSESFKEKNVQILCFFRYHNRGVARILHKGVLTLVRFAVGSMIVASTLLLKKLKGVLEPPQPHLGYATA